MRYTNWILITDRQSAREHCSTLGSSWTHGIKAKYKGLRRKFHGGGLPNMVVSVVFDTGFLRTVLHNLTKHRVLVAAAFNCDGYTDLSIVSTMPVIDYINLVPHFD